MRTKKNLFNFELGTFERMGDELTLTLKRDKFRCDNIAELKRLKQDQAHFLKLATILEQGDSVALNYTIPNGAMPALMSRLWTGFFGTGRYRTPKIFQNPDFSLKRRDFWVFL